MSQGTVRTGPENVVLVSDFANINGGQAKVAIDTAVLLADAGINVHFFAAVGMPDAALSHPRIAVEVLGQHDILAEPNRIKATYTGIWNRAAAAALRACLLRFDPSNTVMHCHGYAKALSPAIGPLMTDGPLPCVYTMHEYFLACPNGGFYDYQKGAICHRRALGVGCLTTHCDVRHPAHKIWRVLRQGATIGPGRIPRRLKDVIYISQTQRRIMAPYLADSTRLHYVPNPVAPPDLPPVDFTGNDLFLFIGRLNPEKGGLVFARAARAAGVKAVFVGDGPEAQAIRAANPDAHITGWQTPAQVQDWIGRAHALVFPSLWSETFGLVAYEAIGRGVPVICGDWNAAQEGVEDGVTGIVYHHPTVDALARAISGTGRLSPFDISDHIEKYSRTRYFNNLMKVYEASIKGHL
ncbi:Glycosyl transferase 4-like domain-containing protein [Monaibacterium marinum]|uniref:Glycosyl transferase 4-like domain-containing protein n=1 Tax=Pontivivens marinum TaxID=1690039 RepID=A0A2C9CWE5_9RHOB|nr:glycosyltransferase family 4 protein [Monaibacterium marinum]SOH95435.1 Glycosyl transferase 4-like domain-containing protein [Monaibacterium marinum]